MMKAALVADVVNAASGASRLLFPRLHAKPEETSLMLLKLAESFGQQNDGSIRRALFGGEGKAYDTLDSLEQTINSTLAELKQSKIPGTNKLDPALLRAIIRLEVDYRGNLPFGGNALPTNVDFDLWMKAFEPYNRLHPQTPITKESIRNDAATNIKAAGIVLAAIDSALDPNITQPARRAMIASIYGDIENAFKRGVPTPYAGKIEALIADEQQFSVPPIPPLPPSPATKSTAKGTKSINTASR